MHKLFIILTLISIQVFGQSKKDYLKENRHNLRSQNFIFPEETFKIVGFGAYHGSVKTEEVELALLKQFVHQNKVRYYLPETDFSTAYYFNTYLQTGDTLLLKDLVLTYGDRVPQERSWAFYNKWKKLKSFNDNVKSEDQLMVVGIDKIASFKYVIKHLLNLMSTKELKSHQGFKILADFSVKNEFEYSAYFDSKAKKMLRSFIEIYKENDVFVNAYVKDLKVFKHVIENIKRTFIDTHPREETIYWNYITLSDVYKFDKYPQFTRFGFFHLEKSREGKDGYPSFFTRLIEQNVYNKKEVISVIGYLTKSKVLWEEKFDKDNKYSGYTVKGGYGIGDYWKEYFRGIKNLKHSALSDLTLFKLNNKNSPYSIKEPDLIEVKMVFNKSNSKQVKEDISTLDFIDYAILIKNSKASMPIRELR